MRVQFTRSSFLLKRDKMKITIIEILKTSLNTK